MLSVPSKVEYSEIDRALSVGLSYVGQMVQGDLPVVMNKINSLV